jgi:hypothetical protein
MAFAGSEESLMNTYCEAHRRKFVGQQCPWCRDAANTKPVANIGANRDVAANGAASGAANTDSYQRYRYRDVEKRRAYMRGYMAERRKASR